MLRIEKFHFDSFQKLTKSFQENIQSNLSFYSNLYFSSQIKFQLRIILNKRKKSKVEMKSILLLNNVIPSFRKNFIQLFKFVSLQKNFLRRKNKNIFILHQYLFCDIFSSNIFKKQFLSNVFSHRSKTKICSQRKIQKISSTTFKTTPEKIKSNQINSKIFQ